MKVVFDEILFLMKMVLMKLYFTQGEIKTGAKRAHTQQTSQITLHFVGLGRVSPSAPSHSRELQLSNLVVANARAAVHDNRDSQRNRHACSALRRGVCRHDGGCQSTRGPPCALPLSPLGVEETMDAHVGSVLREVVRELSRFFLGRVEWH